MKLNKISLIIVLISSIIISSCSTLPVSLRNQIFEENRFHLSDEPSLNDKKVSDYVKITLQPILNHYRLENIKVIVTESYEAQASSLDDKSIYLSKGMLYLIRNEAELVALLGHEVGHLYLKHLEHVTEKETSRIPEITKNILESTTGLSIPDEVESVASDIYLSQFSQRKEQSADEFGAVTASHLGYDAYAFSDLMSRLSDLSDTGISAKLKNFAGSHRSLAKRSQDIQDFLKLKGIKKEGKLASENYLKNVAHLGVTVKNPTSQKAQQTLLNLKKELEARINEQRPLTYDEFLSYAKKIRTIANDLNLLSQLVYKYRNFAKTTEKPIADLFMMESVRVLKPWWAIPSDTFEILENTLGLLSRIGVGSIPFIGDAVDFSEVLTGKDFFTDKDLDFGDRVASALGVFAGTGKQWRSVEKELGELKKVSTAIDSKEVSKTVEAAKEAIEEAPIFGKAEPAESIKDLQRKYRPIKNQESYEKLKELAEKVHEKKIPDDWRVKVSRSKKKSDQGLEFIHPENPHIRVRVMPGNPNAKWPNSRGQYAQQKAHGKYIDLDGNSSLKESNETHIPLDEYVFKDFWTNHGKK